MEEDTQLQLVQLQNINSQLYYMMDKLKQEIAQLKEDIDRLKHIILMLDRAADARDRSYQSLFALHVNLLKLYNNKYK